MPSSEKVIKNIVTTLSLNDYQVQALNDIVISKGIFGGFSNGFESTVGKTLSMNKKYTLRKKISRRKIQPNIRRR